MTAYWTGKKRGPMSQEWKDKISKANKEFYTTHDHHQKFRPGPMTGKKHTEETRKLISRIQIGRKISEEHKQKLSIAFKGRKISEEQKDFLRKRTGAKCPSWKGGISSMPGYSSHHSRLRKLRVRGVDGSHSFQEWLTLRKQYGFKCPCCLKHEPEIKLVKDHIIPIVKGGSNFIENIQPLCQPCNIKKFTKSTKYYLEAEIETLPSLNGVR